MPSGEVVLRADNVGVDYTVAGKVVRAVESVTIELRKGETLAIVGESGCGKSSLARTLVGLVQPTRGTITISPGDTVAMARQNAIQMVFQDPYSSFNPRKRISRSLDDALALSDRSQSQHNEWRDFLIKTVGFGPEVLTRYPHEFSGGQRQRLAIVRALCTGAKIVVFDEPVSALDVSVQAQILNMMADLQVELGLSYVFISHDLAVVKHISDYIAVMYLGRVVEEGPRSTFWPDAKHPYTNMLMNAVPGVAQSCGAQQGPKEAIDVTAINPPKGCVFSPRCPNRQDICSNAAPELRAEARGRKIACHVL
ncbi:oligopeptide/dipeptide ABC transporter ATP-binding protein [Bradyrhizobium sp. NP1]|uniref:oligopeptide/dipeptide ABC transporter ATP-binding protein n=1 Tax=Bradyrhizobium sp. NP1 TaxID=3049772 RepID=UPI0025A564E2|nr:oligopeptide/dipeptide ABC transporter ATP-binding protein [Bradyrhizobium sp. NP1]WJR76806.1 ATP-binding cassette domain-containing protein [Bradyrhizobium sp. NP1]